MQQGAGRFPGHTPISICCSGTNPLEQTQDGSHPRGFANGGHHVHFGRTGITKTNFNAIVDQRFQHALSTIHAASPFRLDT